MSKLRRLETSSPDHPDFEDKLSKNPDVKVGGMGDSFVLSQSFALVRHGDRMDHDPLLYKEVFRSDFPNDTPLAPPGFPHAREVGAVLQKTGIRYEMIVCSPYLRCAQTASCIATILKIPVHFDLDIGEVFDSEAMAGNIAGKTQHRPPDVLEKALAKDFPGVEYFRNESGKIHVEGDLQTFPEDFHDARMRYCFKVKKVVQRSATELISVIFVTHGDAVNAVLQMMKPGYDIGIPPYTGYFIANREVPVYEKEGNKIVPCDEVSVYENYDQWQLTVDPRIECRKMTDIAEKQEGEKDRLKDLECVLAKGDDIHTDYVLRNRGSRVKCSPAQQSTGCLSGCWAAIVAPYSPS